MKKNIFFLLFLIGFVKISYNQNVSELNQLYTVLKEQITSNPDSSSYLLKQHQSDLEQAAFSYLNSFAHLKLREYKASKQGFLKLIKQAEITENPVFQDIFYRLGFSYYKLQNHDSAHYFLRRQIEFEKDKKLNVKTADALFLIGYSFKSNGQKDSVLQYWNTANNLYRKNNDSLGLAKIQINLGGYYRYFENSVSIKHYEKGLKLYEILKQERNIAISHQNLGTLFVDSEMSEKAIFHLNKALTYFESENYTQYQITCLNNLSYAHNNMGDYNIAKKNLKKSIAINDNNYQTELSYSLLNMAVCEMGLKNYKSAEKNYKKAESLFEKLDMKYSLLAVYSGYITLYAEFGDLEKVAKYFRAFKSLKEEEFEEKNRAALAEFEKNFELKEITYHLEITKKEKALKSIEIEKQHSDIVIRNIVILLGILAMTLLLFLLYYIYKSNKKTKSLNTAIQTRNNIIEKNNQELEETVSLRTKELSVAKERAEESDLLKSTFLANISHEIRTPLNAIMGFSNLLSEEETDPEDVKRYGVIVRNNGFDLLNIVDDIIDVSKIEANVYTCNQVLVLHSEIVNSIIVENSEKTKYFNKEDVVELTTSFLNEEVKIITDLFKLNVVFNKLINNALQFTDSGFVNIGSEIIGSKLCFSVTDSGIGIPQERMSQIFENFRKYRNDEHIKYRGLGVGLFIANNILNHMGSELEVESSEEGSKFSFKFNIINE